MSTFDPDRPTMHRLLFTMIALSLPLTMSATSSRALLDLETSALPESRLELVVVEIENCIYCSIFRRDVAPAYSGSQRARSVPMRFIDINAPDVERLLLEGPIDNVPTVLVIEGGREVGRITGYVGPENFFHSLSRLLPELAD